MTASTELRTPTRALPALAALLAACGPAAEPQAPGDTASAPPVEVAAPRQAPPPVSLVDTTLAPAVAGEEGWGYSQAAEADLDGDGEPERVVLTARVEMYRGRPAWDDGQPWQVYVEEADGARTYLYARRVQLGTVTMRVGLAEAGRPASVVVLEQLPDRIALYEAEYRGVGEATVVERFRRAVDPRGETASPALP